MTLPCVPPLPGQQRGYLTTLRWLRGPVTKYFLLGSHQPTSDRVLKEVDIFVQVSASLMVKNGTFMFRTLFLRPCEALFWDARSHINLNVCLNFHDVLYCTPKVCRIVRDEWIPDACQDLTMPSGLQKQLAGFGNMIYKIRIAIKVTPISTDAWVLHYKAKLTAHKLYSHPVVSVLFWACCRCLNFCMPNV